MEIRLVSSPNPALQKDFAYILIAMLALCNVFIGVTMVVTMQARA